MAPLGRPIGNEPMIREFTKEDLVKGQPTHVDCFEIEGQTYSLTKGVATTLRLEEEWYEDVKDPHAVLAALKDARVQVDLFTFWQRLPETEPRFLFYFEWESVAALPVQTFAYWWDKQIKAATRNLLRKSQKKGVEVREACYDDD